jgi:antibiotic biosynthesis monooxygenase (ABM) superfamily enzyme
MEKKVKVGQAVEFIRLKVSSENVQAFLAGRVAIDTFASKIKGYVSTEILTMNGEEFVILIRWDSEEAVKEAQKITTGASIISDWIQTTAQFISFETYISKYEN